MKSSASGWALYGDQSPTLVVAGHSHVLCMLQALDKHPVAQCAVAYNADVLTGPPLADDYWDYVSSLPEETTVAVVWNGNQHHASFLVSSSPEVAVWSEGFAGVANDAVLIPRGMFRELWEPTLQPLLSALERVMVRHRVIILGTPPPKPDDLCRANIGIERWFQPLADELAIDLDSLPITPQVTRLALWQLLQDRLVEIANQYDVPFLGIPSETIDESGLLLPEYSASDATHANDSYGLAMLRKLKKYMDRA